jgi:hypothetical protein
MTSLSASIESHHRPIILSLMALIAVFLITCAFNDAIPICHFVLGCDHCFHLAG